MMLLIFLMFRSTELLLTYCLVLLIAPLMEDYPFISLSFITVITIMGVVFICLSVLSSIYPGVIPTFAIFLVFLPAALVLIPIYRITLRRGWVLYHLSLRADFLLNRITIENNSIVLPEKMNLEYGELEISRCGRIIGRHSVRFTPRSKVYTDRLPIQGEFTIIADGKGGVYIRAPAWRILEGKYRYCDEELYIICLRRGILKPTYRRVEVGSGDNIVCLDINIGGLGISGKMGYVSSGGEGQPMMLKLVLRGGVGCVRSQMVLVEYSKSELPTSFSRILAPNIDRVVLILHPKSLTYITSSQSIWDELLLFLGVGSKPILWGNITLDIELVGRNGISLRGSDSIKLEFE